MTVDQAGAGAPTAPARARPQAPGRGTARPSATRAGRARGTYPAGGPAVVDPLLDPLPDVLLSQDAEWADLVLHVYNDNYLGIRASSSAMAGHKLVLPNAGWDFRRHIPLALEALDRSGATHVVVHGMSNALVETATAVANLRPRVAVFGLWHGSPAQWMDPAEGFELERFLALDRSGAFRRSHVLKPGCDGVLRHPAGVRLVNVPPAVRPGRPRVDPSAALLAATPSIHKNVFANLCAAELCGRIRRVDHYADVAARAPVSLPKARRVPYEGPMAHLRRLAGCAVSLNVTVMDCHPNVDLEAAAVGCVSLHMPLGLGVLDDHPLTDLATVRDPGSIDAIHAALERVLDVPLAQRRELALDYARRMTREGLERYERFLFGDGPTAPAPAAPAAAAADPAAAGPG